MTTNIDQLLSELQTALKNSKNTPGKGIVDTASTEQMIISNSGVTIGTLKVESVTGKLSIGQSLETPVLLVSNSADIKNLRVSSTLTADTLYVKKIISEQPQEKNSDSISFYSETSVDGRGIFWADPDKTRQFIYKKDLNGFYSSENINLAKGSKLLINSVPILEEYNLGPGILHSNLRTLGTLENLTVNGNALLGETLFVNSAWSRVGIGTDKPNSIFSVVDNLTEIVLGADYDGQAFIGTWNNNTLNFITDNTKRISIKGSLVEFGSESDLSSTVKIHGTLEVDRLVYKNQPETGSSIANIFVHPETGQVGIGTKSPHSAFSIVENNVEIIFGSTGNNRAYFGTHGLNGIDIRTDRKNRISITGNSIEVGNSVDNDANLKVHGVIIADSVISKNNTQIFNAGIEFIDSTNNGIKWKTVSGEKFLRLNFDFNTIESTSSVDIPYTSTYKIAGRDVVLAGSLGPSITSSSLTQLGNLEKLSVIGTADIADTVFVQKTKLGINTNNPRASLSVVDNSVEIIISSNNNRGYLGTFDNQPMTIGSGNRAEISVSNGLTEFGYKETRDSVVKIYGTLEVDNLVSDTRIEKTGPVEFAPSAAGHVYYTGLLWKTAVENKRFMLMPSPDRLISSEHIDLANDRTYMINGTEVLNTHSLGNTVVNSNLKKLGVLNSLDVEGPVNLSKTLIIDSNLVTFTNPFTIKDGQGLINLGSTEFISSGSKFSFKLNNSNLISFEENGDIVLGNKNNISKKINAYGQLSVNVTNPDSSVAMAVEGDVYMNNKKFSHGTAAPQTGSWKKADIVWNSEPQDTGYVGWICVVSGNPGIWKPFGHIIDR